MGKNKEDKDYTLLINKILFFWIPYLFSAIFILYIVLIYIQNYTNIFSLLNPNSNLSDDFKTLRPTFFLWAIPVVLVGIPIIVHEFRKLKKYKGLKKIRILFKKFFKFILLYLSQIGVVIASALLIIALFHPNQGFEVIILLILTGLVIFYLSHRIKTFSLKNLFQKNEGRTVSGVGDLSGALKIMEFTYLNPEK